SKRQFWTFFDAGTIREESGETLDHDLYLVPRQSHVTGDILGHEVGWHDGMPVIVNTRFSCLCTVKPEHSFVPIWKPPFITEVVAEDRCHLNGMALDNTGPRYVSALGSTDYSAGWREKKHDGGVAIEVSSGKMISEGVRMPHSPRLHAGKLWVLESG